MCISGLFAFGVCLIAEQTTGRLQTNVLSLDMGTPMDEPFLGFGWSKAEIHSERYFRWVKHLEAEVSFDMDELIDMELSIIAAPLYIKGRRQKIGVYMNNHFIAEWTCPEDPNFKQYQTNVPARFCKKEKNCLILRMGYRKQQKPDPRKLALAVDKIVLDKVRSTKPYKTKQDHDVRIYP